MTQLRLADPDKLSGFLLIFFRDIFTQYCFGATIIAF